MYTHVHVHVVVTLYMYMYLYMQMYMGLSIVFFFLCQEFKAQCFGGDYTGEVYDHVLKKSVTNYCPFVQCCSVTSMIVVSNLLH